MNPEERIPPTDDELFYLSSFELYWLGKSSSYKGSYGDWLFRCGQDVYDLSAADLSKTQDILKFKIFLVKE